MDVGLSLILDDDSGCCDLEPGHNGPCADVCAWCDSYEDARDCEECGGAGMVEVLDG